MKGAKGGQRDKKISRLYRNNNKNARQEEFDAIKSHRMHDGLNLNKDENGINDIEEVEINEEKLEVIENSTVVKDTNSIKPQKTKINLKPKEGKAEKEVIEELDQNEILNDIEEIKQEQETSKEEIIEEKAEDKIEEKKDSQARPPKKAGIAIEQEPIVHDEKIYNEENRVEVNEVESSFIEEQEEYTKQTKLEQEIVLELEKMLREDYYEIKDLEYQLKVLTQKEQDAVLQDEIDDLKQELEALLDKFDIIKKKYEELKNAKDFTDMHLLDNNYLQDLINNYKKEVQDNIVVDDLIKRVKETEDYISIIERIVYVENEKEYLENEIADKKETFEYRDTSFEELEDKYNDVDKINNEIEKFSNELDGIMKDIERKIDNMGTIYTKTQTYSQIVPDMNRLFRAMVQFALSSMIPRTRAGNVARAGLVVSAIHNLSHAFRRERRTETKQVSQFVNYEKDILQNMTNIDSFVGKLDDASNVIKDIKQTFKEELKEYADSIPEFKELMQNIETIEKDLEEKRYYLNKYNNEMRRELERNNAKVLVYKNV